MTTTTTHNPNDCPIFCRDECILGDRCPHRQSDEAESVEGVENNETM